MLGMKGMTLIGALLALSCGGLQAQDAQQAESAQTAAGAEEAAAPGLPNQEELSDEKREDVGASPQEQAQPVRDAPLTFTTREFMAADADGNGILSVEEANEAFPSLSFEDANGDSWLNHAEVEDAVDDIDIGVEGAETYSVVGESDFILIRRAVEESVLEEQA